MSRTKRVLPPDDAVKLCGSVAHDLNNLLSVILGETDLALMFGEVSPELRSSFEAIRKAGDQAAILTQQLLTFSERDSVHGDVGVGATFEVNLPEARAATPLITPAATQPPRGRESILLTEDDEPVRRVAARILQGHGYHVLLATSASDALRILTSSETKVDLLLTDVVLPNIGGRELAERAQQVRPGLRVLFTSGYTDDVILRHRLVANEVPFVRKPLTADSLCRKVREVLDAPAQSLSVPALA